MKKLIVTVLVSAALAACGGKAKKTTMPDNKAGSTTDPVKADGAGGTTYGGATAPAGGATGTADPCAGGAK